MIGRFSRHFPRRALGAFGVVLGLVLAAAATTAVALEGPESSPVAQARRAHVGEWKGRYCTPTGCRGASESPWGNAAGFGAVVLATGWIARRRPTRNA